MTRLEALEALAEKVEAGEWDNSAAWKAFGIGVSGRAERVFRGSLDAAISLHETMLPGWDAHVSIKGRAAVDPERGGIIGSEYVAGDPARAWLLAILKALIAREQTEGGE